MMTVLNLDCIVGMSGLGANAVDAIVTDPPYELGFMGKKWDSTGIAFNVNTWINALNVLKPGGYLLAFGGSRTYHRMTCAIEDAGFEIRDCIMWIYGSGFPKSHNGEWGGTALKPAHEPIILARKPLIGTVAANMAQWGVGGLNIDGCRVEASDAAVLAKNWNRVQSTKQSKIATALSPKEQIRLDTYANSAGRWPANVIHDGSEEVIAGFPESKDGIPVGGKGKASSIYGTQCDRTGGKNQGYGGGGSVARFFYCAKASKKDRDENNIHPTVKPTDLMRYLCRLVTPNGGTILDPFAGSGSTGKAAKLEGFKFIGFELNLEYCDIANQRIAS